MGSRANRTNMMGRGHIDHTEDVETHRGHTAVENIREVEQIEHT